ncbi:MAG: hypothetical protein E7160_01995 [Firmicutes bacterium]|nr:hypothetical protein [Bacillota bacterium]
MNKNYSSLARKYINGEDILEYDIEELENDKDFMIEVINCTNDHKLYKLCSDELKNDYSFVKFLIFKFRHNPMFIITVAEYYLNNNHDDINNLELNIIMAKLLPRDMSLKYKACNQAAYVGFKYDVNHFKSKDKDIDKSLGEGFFLIFDMYNESTIILEYYASRMLDDIFEENNINLEKLLHNEFKSPEKINEVGKMNYIINFIENYDPMLSSYICIHPHLVKELRNKIKDIQKNWDNYSKLDEQERYNNMIDMAYNYMQASGTNMCQLDLLYYVADELGVLDKVEKYNNMPTEFESLNVYFDTNIDEDDIKYSIEHSLYEKLVYLNVRKIMKNQLFSNEPSDLDELIDNKIIKSDSKNTEKSDCKILVFDKKRKKKNY